MVTKNGKANRVKGPADRTGKGDRHRAAAELLAWWGEAAAQLDRIAEGVAEIRAAERNCTSSPADARTAAVVEEMFGSIDMKELAHAVDEAAGQLGCCIPRMPATGPHPVRGILRRLGA